MNKAKRVDIVQLIRHYVPDLRPAGGNLKAICPFSRVCPFHKEKTPSFVVNPERQIFHCFGCGVSGDALDFVMRIEELSADEATLRLAKWPNYTPTPSVLPTPVGVPSGFRKLDKLVSLRKGELTILASRPCQGKTSLALQIASHVARGNAGAVIIFTAGIPRHRAMQRLIGFLAQVSPRDLHSGYFDRKKWPALTRAATRFASVPLALVDMPQLSMEDIRSLSEKFARHFARPSQSPKKVMSLLVIDPLQCVRLDSRRFPDRRAELAEIMLRAKRLAKELDVAVLLVSQLGQTRRPRNSPPSMTDLERSGITEHFDNAILLHGTRRNSSAATLDSQARLLIAKGPAGAMQECVLHFDPAIGMFTNARTK